MLLCLVQFFIGTITGMIWNDLSCLCGVCVVFALGFIQFLGVLEVICSPVGQH